MVLGHAAPAVIIVCCQIVLRLRIALRGSQGKPLCCLLAACIA